MTVNNKVLIFSLAYQPYIGGAEIAVKEITQRMADYQFDLITARFNKENQKEETIGQVRVYRVGWGNKLDKYLFFILAYLRAVKLYQQNHYGIVWAIMANYAGLAALLFKLFKWSYPARYLLTLQEGDSESFLWKRTWFWYPLYRQIYKQADKIQVISQWLEQRARNYGYQGQIDVVPNGVAVDWFSQEISQEDKLSLLSQISRLSQLSIKSDDKVIVTVSRLVEKNGVGDLIESLKYLDDDYKLLIIGQGYLEEDLKQKVSKLNLTERVRFLGKIEHQEIVKYLKISWAFIRPSLSEGFGTVFVEAMAARVPVIATYVGGIKDFLINGQTGLVCQVNNPESIAEQVKRLADDAELYHQLVKNGQGLVKEKYNWEAIAKKMLTILRSLS